MANAAIPQAEWPKSLVDLAGNVNTFLTIDINDPKFNDLSVVPKIGDTTKTKLNDAGIKTVKQLIGMFMVKETKDSFQAWLEGQGVQGGNNVAGPVAIVINNYCHANNL